MVIDVEGLIVYIIIVCSLLLVEHFTLGVWLRDNELARRTFGIITVLLPIPLTVSYDLATLVTIIIGFTAGGLLLVVIVSLENQAERKKEEAEKKRRADLIRAEIQRVADVAPPDR